MAALPSLLLLALTLINPVSAFWRLPCIAPLIVERADPIINPGVPSSHVHTIMGGNAFSLNMTYASTQLSTCSSCTVRGDFSNYWVPQLYYQYPNGSFHSVSQAGGATVYYLQRASPNETVRGFPAGLRMIAGDANKRNESTDEAGLAVSYVCLNYDAPATPETGGFPTTNCPDGLRAQVFFPSCWDGVNVDLEGHKSHMSYPVGSYDYGTCPESHPVRVVSLFYEVIWWVDDWKQGWGGDGKRLFVWAEGDPTGFGLHADFLMGWDESLLESAVKGCTNDSGRVEHWGVFELVADDVAKTCTAVAEVGEMVLGGLDRLSGCNEVQSGPGEAVPGLGCGSGNVSSVSGTVGLSSLLASSGVATLSPSESVLVSLLSAESSIDTVPSSSSTSNTPSPSSDSASASSPLSSASASSLFSAASASGTTSTTTISVTKIHSITIITSASASAAIGPSTSSKSKHSHAKRHGQQLYGDDLRLRKEQRKGGGYVW